MGGGDFPEQQQQQIIEQHPGAPWYFAEDFSWWWTGVFVPIVIAFIVNRAIKKHNKIKQHHKNHNTT